MTTTSLSAAHEPVQALIDRWWELGVSESEAQQQAISELEQTLQDLSEWGQQLAGQLENRETKQQRLEHDVASLRSRVTDLEKTLQDRTEELLRAQAANNALAAELQQAEFDPIADLTTAPATALTTEPITQPAAPETQPSAATETQSAEQQEQAEQSEQASAPNPGTDAGFVTDGEHPDTLAIDEAVSVSARFGQLRDRQSTNSAAG